MPTRKSGPTLTPDDFPGHGESWLSNGEPRLSAEQEEAFKKAARELGRQPTSRLRSVCRGISGDR
jgi:hypothetical protein